MSVLTCGIMLPLLLTALLFAENIKDVDSGPLPEGRDGASHNMKSNPETLEEMMSKSFALQEGDMILPSDRNAVESVWPTPAIPYVISPELESRRDDILAGMAMVSEHTCVTFHERTSETNYLLFKTNQGCASYVGFRGSEQPLFVGPPCIVGNIAHEILHALGFHHEHTRTDRDQYITILTPNILHGKERNFEKKPGQTFNLPYDITSILHYGGSFFTGNGLPTIIANTDGKEMGQRERLTERDVERVRLLYNCDAIKKEVEKEEESNAHESTNKPE